VGSRHSAWFFGWECDGIALQNAKGFATAPGEPGVTLASSRQTAMLSSIAVPLTNKLLTFWRHVSVTVPRDFVVFPAANFLRDFNEVEFYVVAA
jgi:hypothetical protein